MKKNGFMEGAIIATIAIIISKILGVLYVIPFYSIIGNKGGALYGYAYTIYNTFLIISSAGIPLAISKITSEYETKKEYTKKIAMFNISKKAIFAFSLASFLICFLFAKPIAILIIGNLSGGNTISDVTFVIRCVSFALLVVPLLSISRGYLQGHKYISASSMSQVIEQIVRIAVILIGSFIMIKILHWPLTLAVGLSVFSACIGAIIGYIYLIIKMKNVPTRQEKSISKEDKKEIIHKLIGYCVPFIIINIACNIYNTTDMILVIRGLNHLNFPAEDIETISSIFTTWGNKLISVVKAFATGLTISLIPSLVNSYVKKDHPKMNYYFNKTLEVLLIIIFPITVFMSIFAEPIWSLFYGNSYYGPIIFRYLILTATFESAYLLICSALQGINKTKLVYIAVIAGLLTNLILDLPLMYLFNKIGFYPYYGAITATMLGHSITMAIALINLKKTEKFSYKSALSDIPKAFASIILISIICILYKHLMPYRSGVLYNIIYIGIIGVIFVGLYCLMNKATVLNTLELKSKFTNKERL